MNIYRISQTMNRGWDTYSDAVVVVANETDAKNTHPDKNVPHFDPSLLEEEKELQEEAWSYEWALPEFVKVEYVGKAVDTIFAGTILCASYHAG